MSTAPLRPTTLEIDLDAAAGNLRAVRGLVGPARKMTRTRCVVFLTP